MGSENVCENMQNGFATFDMIFAAIVVLFILYVYLAINDAIVRETLFEQRHAAGLLRTVLLSERLVKLDLAKEEGPIKYANVISGVKNDVAEQYVDEFGVTYVSISLSPALLDNHSEAGSPAVAEKYCIRRIVLIPGGLGQPEKVGALDVCTGK